MREFGAPDAMRRRESCGSDSRRPARWRVGEVAGSAASASVASWWIRRLPPSFDAAVPSTAHQADGVRRPERYALVHPHGPVYQRLPALHRTGTPPGCVSQVDCRNGRDGRNRNRGAGCRVRLAWEPEYQRWTGPDGSRICEFRRGRRVSIPRLEIHGRRGLPLRVPGFHGPSAGHRDELVGKSFRARIGRGRRTVLQLDGNPYGAPGHSVRLAGDGAPE